MSRKGSLLKSGFTMLLLIIIIIAAGGSVQTAYSAQVDPAYIALTWSDDPRTTQALTWQTADPALDQLQYILAGVGSDFSVTAKTLPAEREYILDGGDTMVVYSALLTGLKPGTRYSYRIGNGEAWSEVHFFQTAADDVTQFEFFIFGDSQSTSYDTWHKTLQRAYQAHPEAAFFTNVGDLVDVGQNVKEWQDWFAASQGVIDTIPAMPLTGNHEMYTPVRKVNALPALFTAQFRLPFNGPEGLKEQVYSFDYGNVHFVMLDSQEREEKQFIPDMLDKQRDWLEKDLALTDKRWKLVFLHRPPYHSKSATSNDRVREAFVPILDKYHADVVFSGHEHVYARTYPLYADSIANQGTVYITTGRSGTKYYNQAEANGWDEVFYNPVDQPNYLTVQIAGDTLAVKAWKQDGELIDEWHVDKSDPVRLGMAAN